MKRSTFIRNTTFAGMALGLGSVPLEALAAAGVCKLTILHTNDQHSRIEPFPMDGGKFQGLGGFAQRAAIIKKIRQEEKNVLLLDSGDIWQGTPYFNVYGGELEFKLMTQMGYDAATLGNHDFDAGTEGLARQLPHAGFPFLNCNYTFEDTPLEGKIHPYKIFRRGPVSVGVFGVGIELEGLVPRDMFGQVRYNNPVTAAQKTAALLKNELQCDVVICLSHLGYQYEAKKVSDKILAAETDHIDLILGGHTHTFMDKPDELKNASGKKVLVHQVGWAGIYLGRVDFYLEPGGKTRRYINAPVLIG